MRGLFPLSDSQHPAPFDLRPNYDTDTVRLMLRLSDSTVDPSQVRTALDTQKSTLGIAGAELSEDNELIISTKIPSLTVHRTGEAIVDHYRRSLTPALMRILPPPA